MQTIQIPVAADLRIEGMGLWGLVTLSKKERPQYSCNSIKCVKERWAIARGRLPKKFAPEIEVPAQMNQNCVLSLFMVECDVDAVHSARSCWPAQRASSC